MIVEMGVRSASARAATNRVATHLSGPLRAAASRGPPPRPSLRGSSEPSSFSVPRKFGVVRAQRGERAVALERLVELVLLTHRGLDNERSVFRGHHASVAADLGLKEVRVHSVQQGRWNDKTKRNNRCTSFLLGVAQ